MIYLASLILGLAVSALTIPLIIKLSHRLDLLDHPDPRKVHSISTPRLGGVAIFLGVLIGLAFFVSYDNRTVHAIQLAASILFVTGFIDDIFSIGVWKLMGQSVGVLVLVFNGVMFVQFSFDSSSLQLGMLAIPLSFIALITVVNSINLIDGIDGLAGGYVATTLVFFTGFFFWSGQTDLGIACLVVLGSVLGFLYFNLHPARIFMGDSGSNLLGLFIAACGMLLFRDGMLSLVNVLFMIFLPLTDTFVVFTKRILRGMNPMLPSKNHFHHLLLAKGISAKNTVRIFISITFALDLFAVVGEFWLPRVFSALVLTLLTITVVTLAWKLETV